MFFKVFALLLLQSPDALNIFNRPFFTNRIWKLVDNNNAKIIFRKSNKVYTQSNISIFNDKYEHDKLILLTPGGINGFYMLGTITYIEEHYKLKSNYIYSGASAGAWNGLLLSNINSTSQIISKFILDSNVFNSQNSLYKTQQLIKEHLLNNYRSSEFNFTKLFIGVTQYNNCKFYTNIYTDFYDLEDAIDCCIASSHIPLITNGLITKYSNEIAFDGGFSTNPYIQKDSSFIIKPDIWNPNMTNALNPLEANIIELYRKGYYDCEEHVEELDKFFKY
jgi:hypothetical protein